MQILARMHANMNFAYAVQIGFMLIVLLLLQWYRRRYNHPPTSLDKALATLIPTLAIGLILFLITAVFTRP